MKWWAIIDGLPLPAMEVAQPVLALRSQALISESESQSPLHHVHSECAQ
jgi:hypothetical protein